MQENRKPFAPSSTVCADGHFRKKEEEMPQTTNKFLS